MWSTLLAALLLAGVVSALAAGFGALTPGGACAATAVGAVIYMGGGLSWCAVLLLFFLTSSALSHLGSASKQRLDIAARSERRDAVQVLANGGVPALCAALAALHPSPLWSTAFAGAVAAATADTWATELGTLSPAPPVLITTLRPVPRGTSGAVSALGSTAAAAGSLFIGASCLLLGLSLRGGFAVALAGFTAALLDSLLGATVQERRLCPVCGTPTEQRVHRRCGTPTARVGGISGLDNDDVNALASAGGALLALLFSSIS